MKYSTANRDWENIIFNPSATGREFEQLAVDLFKFQYYNCTVYKEFVYSLAINPDSVTTVEEIPFLPISLFKTHEVKTTAFEPEIIFESSGTTGSTNSRHFVKDVDIYRTSFNKSFNLFYSDPSDWCILGLLPSYLQKGNSSLVYMVNEFIQESDHHLCGFHMDDFEKLYHTLLRNEISKQPTLLIGVTYALLDFAEQFPLNLNYTTIMETGGMKGRRKEMIRAEVHDVLKKQFGVDTIHSEYGMTELLSQAYSKGEGVYKCPPWMKVYLRDEDDPLKVTRNIRKARKPSTGLVNVIDLANIYSCAFIGTDDIGRLHPDGQFEVLGRSDNSDTRGCSLLSIGNQF